MSNYESDTEILDINIDISEFLSDEEESVSKIHKKEETRQTNLLRLKLFRKGSMPIDESQLLNYFTHTLKLDVRGLFFVKNSSVLVEVELDDSARNYLISIFEERLGSKVLKRKSIKNIVELCDGKFQIVIGNSVIHLVVLSNIEPILLPCKTSVLPHGLSNGNIMNLLSGKFNIDPKFTLFDSYELLKNELSPKSLKLSGLRIEAMNDDPVAVRVRFLVMNQDICEELLIKMKKIFGMTYFSAETLHFFPAQKAVRIAEDFMSTKLSEVSSKLSIIAKDDLINVRAKNIKTDENGSKAGKDNTSSLPTTSATHIGVKSSSMKQIDRAGIRDRLGGKIRDNKRSSTVYRNHFYKKSRK